MLIYYTIFYTICQFFLRIFSKQPQQLCSRGIAYSGNPCYDIDSQFAAVPITFPLRTFDSELLTHKIFRNRVTNHAIFPSAIIEAGKKGGNRMDDTELIALYLARDERAIRETEAAYGGLCRSTARNILGNMQDAEECVNDALLKVWNAIPPANPAHFAAYLLTAVRRIALDRYEHSTAEKRGGSVIPAALDELSDCLPSRDDVAAQCEAKALSAAVSRFLTGLPARQRNVFVARYFSLRTVREIAADYKISVSNVKITLMRTRNALKVFLRKEELL